MPYRTPEAVAAKKQQFLASLRIKYGNVFESCKLADISRRAFYNWLEDDKDFVVAYKDALEDALDNVESALLLVGMGAKKGNPTALLGVLNARAKHRGYGTYRQEITGLHGGAIEHRIRAEGLKKLTDDELDALERIIGKTAVDRGDPGGTGEEKPSPVH